MDSGTRLALKKSTWDHITVRVVFLLFILTRNVHCTLMSWSSWLAGLWFSRLESWFREVLRRPMSQMRLLSHDFVARVRDFITRQCRRRCDCQIAHCDFVSQRNMASAPLFPFHDPPSQIQFQNDEIVPYLIFSELFDWSYAFVLQDSLLKLNPYEEYHNQSCWFGLFTRQSRSVQLRSRVLRHCRAMKSRDKIAR